MVTRASKLTMRTEKEGKELEIAKETQKLNWYVSMCFKQDNVLA